MSYQAPPKTIFITYLDGTGDTFCGARLTYQADGSLWIYNNQSNWYIAPGAWRICREEED